MFCVSVQDYWGVNNRLDLWQLRTRKKKSVCVVATCQGWLKDLWGVWATCSEHFWCCTGGGSAWITFVVSSWYFFSTRCCLIAGEALNFFLVQEGQDPGRGWIGSAVLCHAWLRRREGLHGGYELLKSLWCVIKKKSPCLRGPRKSLGSGGCTAG